MMYQAIRLSTINTTAQDEPDALNYQRMEHRVNTLFLAMLWHTRVFIAVSDGNLVYHKFH